MGGKPETTPFMMNNKANGPNNLKQTHFMCLHMPFYMPAPKPRCPIYYLSIQRVFPLNFQLSHHYDV